ncbi:MAG: DUF4870 domain-containing protein [Actinobacteria bacterium]|nr:DUF4870 domain-containing protein [Actinomycetota bacterium]
MSTPPGWYPDGSGNQRYWDGVKWTDQIVPGPPGVPGVPFGGQVSQASDDTTLATITHILALFSWFLGPLIIYLVRGKDSAFVRHHAVEALNFGITVFIASFVSGIAILLVVGLVMLPIVLLWGFIMPIIAAIAASRGEWYRYPLTLRLIPGN